MPCPSLIVSHTAASPCPYTGLLHLGAAQPCAALAQRPWRGAA